MVTLVMVAVIWVAVLTLSAETGPVGPGDPAGPGAPAVPAGPEGPVLPLQAASRSANRAPSVQLTECGRNDAKVSFADHILRAPRTRAFKSPCTRRNLETRPAQNLRDDSLPVCAPTNRDMARWTVLFLHEFAAAGASWFCRMVMAA